MRAADSPSSNQYYELRFVQLRNSKTNQRDRVVEFLEKQHLPMTQRHGIGPVGYLSVSIGPDTPKLIILTAYESLADMEKKTNALHADKEYIQAAGQFGSADDPPYDRQEVWLLRAFDGMPKLDIPPQREDKGLHLFELRTYESETDRDNDEKINMFNTEEMKIFRHCGIHPVFFGKTLFGSKIPNLTYMVWYDDLEARTAAWKKFGDDADWKRIRSKPGWTNADIVSTVSNIFLQPLPFSPIR